MKADDAIATANKATAFLGEIADTLAENDRVIHDYAAAVERVLQSAAPAMFWYRYASVETWERREHLPLDIACGCPSVFVEGPFGEGETRRGCIEEGCYDKSALWIRQHPVYENFFCLLESDTFETSTERRHRDTAGAYTFDSIEADTIPLDEGDKKE